MSVSVNEDGLRVQREGNAIDAQQDQSTDQDDPQLRAALRESQLQFEREQKQIMEQLAEEQHFQQVAQSVNASTTAVSYQLI